MKRTVTAFAFLLMTASLAAAAGFEIQAKEKTVGKHEGADQDLPRGASRAVREEKVIEFEIRNLVPRNGVTYRVEWIVLTERSDGRIAFGTQGEKEITPRFGERIEWKT